MCLYAGAGWGRGWGWGWGGGGGDDNDDEEIRGLNKAKLCKIIKQEFNTLWQTEVNSFPKADTYIDHSKTVKFESYLTNIKNRKLRVTFTKYRLSDHCLMIEKGRRKRPSVPREERFCPFCAYKNRTERCTQLC